ncbi:cyclin-like protein [Suillus clintonianus]|uniref:cyclin-like protein n=1 Tax=Suillus clintonianus TaxID=1904413 RepID=UPI001B873F84|nr:cyclin-like protein [Suillus clintonianus]KAG2139696.1 cyclin-like protein [Suillus clintonianus]
MATDFWASSHYKRWIVDRATLKESRSDDLQYVDDPEYLDFFAIFFANVITKLGKKLNFRQRVISTAIVFFRRFYIKNSYCETDPFIVIAACCYVAGKAEESPVHIKNMVAEARLFFSQQPYGVKYFPSDNSKLAEMEFYLVADLECDLTVFHPYRTLLSICKKESSNDLQTEAGEVGVGVDDGPRYWGSGDGQLELPDDAFQLAWSIINDTYRSDLCLLYPPHLLAITALYLAVVLHGPTRELLQQQSHSADVTPAHSSPRRSSRQNSSTSSSHAKKPSQDFVAFFAELNISMSLVATIAQEIISLYTLWERYLEDSDLVDSARTSFHGHASSQAQPGASHSGVSTPVESLDDVHRPHGVTPTFLLQVLTRMRENRLSDMAHASSGRPVAVNKMLERTQAAG